MNNITTKGRETMGRIYNAIVNFTIENLYAYTDIALFIPAISLSITLKASFCVSFKYLSPCSKIGKFMLGVCFI